MKSKIKTFLKITALFLCVMMILPMALACGKKDEETATPAAGNAGDAAANNETVADDIPAPIAEEPPTDPPPTEAPTEPIDPNLPYYEYLDAEFARFGFTGGDRIIADTEEEVMNNKFGAKGCSRMEIDLSGENVPFDYAYRYEITELAENFWDKDTATAYNENKTITEGDILAGCLYVRDAGGPNPAQFYLAIKTPTDNWSTEGQMNVYGYELEPGKGWEKIYFYGEFLNDENPASTAYFNIFLGYEPHTIDIGGIYIMRYPGTDANVKATFKMP